MRYLILLIFLPACAPETMTLNKVEWECIRYEIRPIYVPVGKEYQEVKECVQLVKK